ncbi:putative aluminum-activated malate transporter [Helianthus annuus]|nr:putative aluminum-activated malate transporter [Helianthus annuus]
MVIENASSTTPTTLFTRVKTIASSLKIKHVIVDFAINIKKIAEVDSRRITHSLKVALAIIVVSMIYFVQPFYNGMGEAGLWAILTVVLVSEFTGLNRGFATLLAGALGVGAESFASVFGPTIKPIILGFLLFLIVALATFLRFAPSIKRRYDYGVLIFILTFALVSVSGYRVEKILKLAQQRFTTIVLAGAMCVIISIFVCPVWAGEELHKLIVNNLEKLASFLEGFGDEYYRTSNGDKSFLTAYKSVLNSKGTEESLTTFAWWEIGHGKFRFRHPWKEYLKVGVYTRKCAYHIETLNGHLEAKDEAHSKFKEAIKEPCMTMSSEVGKVLKELGSSLKLMIYPSSSAVHIKNCKEAVEELNTALRASMVAEYDIQEIIPVIASTSILVEIIKCVETISEAIEDLSKQAHFLNIGLPQMLVNGGEEESITITIL